MVYCWYDDGSLKGLEFELMASSGNNGKEKIKRVIDSMHFRNPDIVPIGDIFFWAGFIEKWRTHFALDKSVEIFEYYDHDLILCSPNIDPHIDNVREIEKTDKYVIYRGGFGSILKLDADQPVPDFIDYAVKDAGELENFIFQDPHDDRRYSSSFAFTDQYEKEPPFSRQLDKYGGKFFLLGNICEARETIWRIMGMEGEFLAIKDNPEIIKRFALRVADFNIELGKAQLENQYINGLLIYGDIGYKNGLFMSPADWKEIYYPALKKICDRLKVYGKPIIYHTDGHYLEIMEDLIEAGINAIHPNEAKAGIDVVELIEEYRGKIAFFGNIDAANALSKDRESIRKEVQYKIEAASGGGYIPGGDDIPSSVSPENYDYYMEVLKSCRTYLAERTA